MGTETHRKLFYKIGEVCNLTGTQPYVLRFWESEFPQLAPRKNKTGQRLYRRRDVDMVMEIKRLLHDEGYTIAGARKKLGMESSLPDSVVLAREEESIPETLALLEAQEEIRSSLSQILEMMDATDRRIRRS